ARAAATGKPMIMSTGMATLQEVEEAVGTARAAGSGQIALLKCTSAYPASPEEMNLLSIPDMVKRFGVPVGLSDHTRGIAVAVTAVALGASIVEKHFTLLRDESGLDSEFSLEPAEFKAMVKAVRTAEAALGEVRYGLTEREKPSTVFRRSLFVVKDMRAGETFTEENVRSIRPGLGLPPKYLYDIHGRRSSKEISSGTPMNWELVAGLNRRKP
ncbi:unnamed protein product, partial [marine sediment metagenome]